MVESNKGWTTEYILNLPICRVRQVLELIQQDLRDQAKFKVQIAEWTTKNICAMFATQAESQKQAGKIMKAVEKMSLPLSDEQTDIIDERSFDEVVEQGAKVDVEHQPGFEALNFAFKNL